MLTAYSIDPLRDPRWAEFVERHPRASVFHTPGWLEALRRTYGYEPVAYTTTPPGANLTNGVVLCRVYSRITGRRMVSLPFSDHCEPLVERPEDLDRLLHALEIDCAKERWKYVEIRPRTPCAVPPGRLEPNQAFYFHAVDLSPQLNEIFHRFHRESTHRKIRRAEREGLTCEEGRSAALLEKFYQLLLRTRRRLRLPPHPRDWFRNLVDCMGDKVNIRTATKAGRPIASILTLSFRDGLVYKYGCSDERFHNLGGMPLLLSSAIQQGKGNGAREFDMGRSDVDNPGLITFKENWGATRSQLTYWRYPTRLAAATTRGRRPKAANGIFPYVPDSFLVAAWRTKVAKGIFPYIPDSLLIAAGKLFYKHIG